MKKKMDTVCLCRAIIIERNQKLFLVDLVIFCVFFIIPSGNYFKKAFVCDQCRLCSLSHLEMTSIQKWHINKKSAQLQSRDWKKLWERFGDRCRQNTWGSCMSHYWNKWRQLFFLEEVTRSIENRILVILLLFYE